jgi:hypothetical protein
VEQDYEAPRQSVRFRRDDVSSYFKPLRIHFEIVKMDMLSIEQAKYLNETLNEAVTTLSAALNGA